MSMLSVYPFFYPECCPTMNAAQYARHVGKKHHASQKTRKGK